MTAPPSDFLDADARDQYGVPLRAVCSWMEIHNFFLNEIHLKNQFLTGLTGSFVNLWLSLSLTDTLVRNRGGRGD
jgi:hypothetical protein